ncbi:NADPH-dependent 2,4-dienoyl-CoA reductase, sulfur reductase [Ferrimonas sediminum]|uniref:NADPH-dependent 2,4-dienoyl-CoA reductase, sulfur reductase n=1 Tax=Ferrimonas sediminum TaxID=718193 RepID=A0A1G8K3I0_9GAMM|nr:CoA-disulfide reductase [Ferrimonas sediminum]SDI37370.1 NADPH-dependent 2,4-dienoyl-CoA reductase, sulfur reductase [Ferrimonas sediminum]
MKIVIIGGEAAGMSAAAKARRTDKGAEIIVFEQSEVVSFGACGLPYFIGDSFDEPAYMAERSVAQFRDSGIDLRIGHRVEQLDADRQQLLVTDLASGERFTQDYDSLMIATGASVVKPPIEGLALQGVHFLKTLDDGLTIKPQLQSAAIEDVVVIGAGYIGLEVVEALVHQGKRVRLIELSERVLTESFDTEISELIQQELVDKGVQLHLQEAVQSLSGEQGRVCSVQTDAGQYRADMVIVATGVRPNSDFVADTGIERLGNGAIIIDEQGRTSLRAVYAAGDCATVWHRVRREAVYLPLATTANKLGRMIGENLCGGARAFPGTLGSAGVKVLAVEAGRTGISEREAQGLGLDYKTVVIDDKNTTNYVPDQQSLRVKLVYDRVTKRLLGGQVAGGPGAVLRVDTLAAAIHAKMTTADLGMLDLVYAPPFARTWDAINVAGNVAK